MTPDELRTIRQRLGWTQAEAADRLGVSGRSYRYTEQGINSKGTPLGNIQTAIAVAMLGYALAAEIEVAAAGPVQLATFRNAVQRELRDAAPGAIG